MRIYAFTLCLLVGSWTSSAKTTAKAKLRNSENLTTRDSSERGILSKLEENLALCMKQKNSNSNVEENTDAEMLEVGEEGYDGFHDDDVEEAAGPTGDGRGCISGVAEGGRALRFRSPEGARAPASVDWRRLGAVTAVRDQGSCQSCWAFSAVGALEGQLFLKTGRLVALSEQNLVDCARGYGNYGCGGGSMVNAFRYVSDTEGLLPAEAYPYRGKNGRCRYRRKFATARAKAAVVIESGSEQQLMEAVAFVGPISAAIDASWRSFKHYRHGVYYEPMCSSARRDLTHAVLVVGYGTDRRGRDYWLVKNSMGVRWGERGYARLARNRGNNCGIATTATYPLV